MIKELKDIKNTEVNLFGGKAANLGFLLQNGYNVPEGFCISTKIKNIDGKIKKEIIKKFRELKSKVAVRSSATAEDSKNLSFAGQFDTFLNIKNEKDLINSIKKCKNSVKSKRAISYAKNKKITNIKMAVIVQKMIDSEFAGVIFTIDPVNKKDILIEIVKGLGDKLVSGKVTPNSYFIDRKRFNIKNKILLFDFDKNNIKKLAETSLKIESLYKCPQNIEFAVENNEIFILQSRPITTL